jgi:Flp pilus assembly protein TadD
MPSADRSIRFALVLLAATMVGCATSVSGPDRRAPTSVKHAYPGDAGVSADATAAYARALEAMRTGRVHEAERVLQQLVKNHPDLAGPYANLGILYHRLDRGDEAEQVLKQAIKLNPNQPAYHNQLGIVYRSSGKFSDAHLAYQKALAIDPKYLYAHLNIGILYDLYLGNTSLALQHYQRYQQLIPSGDKQVDKWIADLKNRTSTADKKHGRGSG